MRLPDWLELSRGNAGVLLSIPHSGTGIPAGIEATLHDPDLARRDTDWWLERLYDFAPALGITVLRTRVSRSVIDVNRDPSGVSLYPGMTTTELCPTATFDGEALYPPGYEVSSVEMERRRREWFDPYHETLTAEIDRLRASRARVVLFDAHSIRSRIPRLFEGELPALNLGTNSGRSCAAELIAQLAADCRQSGFSYVVDGRFKGGWITRHYGNPARGVHGVQLELACRTYLDEPGPSSPDAPWPAPYEPRRALPLRATLRRVLETCCAFSEGV